MADCAKYPPDRSPEYWQGLCCKRSPVLRPRSEDFKVLTMTPWSRA
jgi:hypothetical protein